MTKILIMSDTHGLRDEINQIRNRHNVEYLIHCGDSELQENDPVLDGFITVKGNCDFEKNFPHDQLIIISDVKFLITHGHLYHVKTNLTTLSYRASEVEAQIICYGHTHNAGVEKWDNQLFINPGSIKRPKNRLNKTYVLLTLENKNITVQFYTLDGQVVPELSIVTSLD